jgi:Kdo2-lipid IVA lauroyltransferase/acyltransferase
VKFLKKIRYIIEYIPVFILIKGLRLLPFCALKILSHTIGSIMYLVPPVGRLTTANVVAAFPGKSRSECCGIARRSLGNLVLGFVEFFWMVDNMKRIEKYAHMHHAEDINHHADRQESILFVTPHFGNWEIAGLLMTHYTRMRFVVIAKPIRNPYFNKLVNGCRETGNKVIYSKGAVREVMKAMREGFGLGSLIDQNTRVRDGGVFIDFFGLPVPVSRMPAMLGKRKGNFPYFGGVRRDPETGHLHSYINHLPKPIEEYESDEEIISDFMKLTEEMIRQYPDQYLWFYKRFQNIPRDASPELRAKYPWYAKVASDRFYDKNAPKPAKK